MKAQTAVREWHMQGSLINAFNVTRLQKLTTHTCTHQGAGGLEGGLGEGECGSRKGGLRYIVVVGRNGLEEMGVSIARARPSSVHTDREAS